MTYGRLGYFLYFQLLVLFSQQLSAAVVRGTVFYDKNQNGALESNESGVGGVYLKLGNKKVITDSLGSFEIENSVDIDFLKLVVDKNSVPPGSIFTNNASFFITKKSANFKKFLIGVYYPKVSTSLDSSILDLEDSTKVTTAELSVSEDKLLMNDTVIYQSKDEEINKESFNRIKIINKEINRSELQEYLSILKFHKTTKNHSMSVEILISKIRKNDTEYFEEVAKEFEEKVKSIIPDVKFNFLMKTVNYIKSEQLKITHSFNSSKNLLCSYKEDNSSSLLTIDKFTKVTIKSNPTVTKGTLTCNKKRIRFSHYINKNKIAFNSEQKVKNINLKFGSVDYVKSEIVKDDGKVFLNHSKFLEYSRDPNIHFEFKNNLANEVTYNNKAIVSGDTFVYNAKEGKNEIELQNRNTKEIYKYSFDHLKLPSIVLNFYLSQYTQKTVSNRFDVNYKIGRVERMGAMAQFFHPKNYGLDLRLIQDMSEQSFRSNDGGKRSAKHSEYQLHAVFRDRIDNNEYDSLILKYYLGIVQKKFPLDNNVIIQFPKDFNAIHLGVELENPSFIFDWLSTSTSFFYGFQNPEDHSFKLTQDVRISLNSLGRMFGVKPNYIYYYRYSMWDNIQLHLAGEYERDRKEAANIDRARVLDQLFSWKVGLIFNY